MKLRISDADGNVAYVDNEGQVNGKVEIQGVNPLASHIDRLINTHLDLPFRNQANTVDGKFILIEEGKFPQLYKASDLYLNAHFIAVECPLFGYEVEVIKE